MSRKVHIDIDGLVKAARQVRKRAYAPYSKFKVGAALLGESGRVYLGCNMENASYGLALCAERGAFAQGIAAGEKRFRAIAVTGKGPRPVPPCGMCRQTIAELMPPSAPVICDSGASAGPSREIFTVAEILPGPFTKKFL